jgi:DNA processing protein
MEGASTNDHQDRLALLGLWAIPGVGPKTLERIARDVGPLSGLLDAPSAEWAHTLELQVPVRQRLAQLRTLRAVSERVQERVARGGMRVAYAGDADYPENLVGLPDAPPLLFVLGERRPGSRRRLAMVGGRRVESDIKELAQSFARDAARAGLCIVSGAAAGVDKASHLGARDAGQETWAFLGSALDELDSAQASLAQELLGRGGVFYSELPPGVRASEETFPRRNRLISGASDAVLVVRAAEKSGSVYTVEAAEKQGRPVLAMPGDPHKATAAGVNSLLHTGRARLCLGIADVLKAVGMDPATAGPSTEPTVELSLSKPARVVLGTLGRTPQAFEEVMGACRLASGAVTSALCELELLGLVTQLPGKVYEKV